MVISSDASCVCIGVVRRVLAVIARNLKLTLRFAIERIQFYEHWIGQYFQLNLSRRIYYLVPRLGKSRFKGPWNCNMWSLLNHNRCEPNDLNIQPKIEFK